MKLNEVVMPANDQMTTNQKIALLSIFIAQANSPLAGAEALKGSPQKMAAGEYLIQKGYVSMSNGGITTTQSGMAELASSGLVAQGIVTDMGKKLINPQAIQQAAPTPVAPPPAPVAAANVPPTNQGNLP